MSFSKRRQTYGPFRNRPKPKRNQRKAKTPPEPPIQCAVKYLPTGKFLQFNKEAKELFAAGDFSFNTFPSKHKAQIAIWHTVQKSGKPGSHVDYEIVPVS